MYTSHFTCIQDACTAVHSACRRKENGHNLDIWVLRLSQGQMQIFLCLKVWKGLDFQKWGLNRVHETERSVFPIPRVFGMCRRRFLCKVEKGVALTTDCICLQKTKKGTLFTPPARRAWRSCEFAPFLFFFYLSMSKVGIPLMGDGEVLE